MMEWKLPLKIMSSRRPREKDKEESKGMRNKKGGHTCVHEAPEIKNNKSSPSLKSRR